ncbi:LysR substrate-binding domain-containing protein [Amycolatopsis pithecellobii]|uniref:LysR substrate-binding domain-containing protein n=1 Tax=Amycolatopsis pithecellobii TaxID=664692 RepID=A0A6N7Z7N0_9PSEU|nr:LysR substrate-binding domain-containing protein [Amycolatopsis pithecellobii]MTD57301.1 hypothetical protein [Amycolatopsis pithecellobii]
MVIVSRDHALAGRDTAKISGLVDEPFITFHRGASTHQALLDAFAAIDRVPQASFESADLSAAFALVKRRLGVALVPRSVAELDPLVSHVSLVPSQAQTAFSRLARSLLTR